MVPRLARRPATTQDRLPVADIQQDTIVLTDGGIRQVLECQPAQVALKDEDEQFAVQDAWAELLHSLTHPLQVVLDIRPAEESDLWLPSTRDVSPSLSGIAASYRRLLSDLCGNAQLMQRAFYTVVPWDRSPLERRKRSGGLTVDFSRLEERSRAVAERLERAGVRSRRVPSEELAAILYRHLNGVLARRQPLALQDLLTIRVRDLLAPSAFEHTRDGFAVGDRCTRTLAVAGYPRYLHFDWLQIFLSLRSAFRVALFISPVPSELAMPYLEKKIAELASSVRLSVERAGRVDVERQAALEDARALQVRLARSEERFFDLAIYVTMDGRGHEALETETARLEAALGGLMLKSRRTLFQMEQGYWSTLPMAADRLGIRRSMTTAALRVTFPFSASNFSQPQGILYGQDPVSGIPVFLDRFALPNANGVVLAQSGAGKSYAVKVEVLRALLSGIDVLVVDPEGEYVKLAEAVGGKVESIRPNAPQLPSAFALGSAAASERQLVLVTLFRLLLPSLSAEEVLTLQEALGRIYAFKGITDDSSSAALEPPSVVNLLETLDYQRRHEPDPAVAALARKVRGLLDGPSGWLLQGADSSSLVGTGLSVIALAGIPDEARSAAMFLVLDRLWQHLRRREPRRNTLVVIDEAWWLIRHPDTARFVFRLAKTARKLQVGLTVVTQDVADLLASEAGKTVITNASVQLLLKQASQAMPELAETFGLTKPERSLLINAPVGEGILIARGSRTPICVVGSEEEDQLART